MLDRDLVEAGLEETVESLWVAVELGEQVHNHGLMLNPSQLNSKSIRTILGYSHFQCHIAVCSLGTLLDATVVDALGVHYGQGFPELHIAVTVLQNKVCLVLDVAEEVLQVEVLGQSTGRRRRQALPQLPARSRPCGCQRRRR